MHYRKKQIRNKSSRLGPGLANSIQNPSFFKHLTGSEDRQQSLDIYLNDVLPHSSRAHPMAQSYNMTPAPLIGTKTRYNEALPSLKEDPSIFGISPKTTRNNEKIHI
jgi:hypothetical protein